MDPERRQSHGGRDLAGLKTDQWPSNRAEDAPNDLCCSAVTVPYGVGVHAQCQRSVRVPKPFGDCAYVDACANQLSSGEVAKVMQTDAM